MQRPYAYLFPARLTRVVDNLQRHGIRVDELREDIDVNVEVYRASKVERGITVGDHTDPGRVRARVDDHVFDLIAGARELFIE